MIFNCGPHGGGSSSGIDFNFGGKFPIEISFTGGSSFNELQDGEQENKYFFKQGSSSQAKDWYLIIFDSCNLKIAKDLTNIEIGAIGAGGGGGVEGEDPQESGSYNEYYPFYERAGGGGGAGGYRVKKMFNTFSAGTYSLTIGNFSETYGDGGETNIKNNSNNYIIQAQGGKAGNDSTIHISGESKQSTQNQAGVEVPITLWVGYGQGTPGEGGTGTYSNCEDFNNVPIGTVDSPASASGGKGGSNGAGYGSDPVAGSFGQQLFEEGIFGDNSYIISTGEHINDIIVVGAGGGGGGSTAWGKTDKPSASHSQPPIGMIDSPYGRGGQGGAGISSYTSPEPRAGGKGLIIIRHKQSN